VAKSARQSVPENGLLATLPRSEYDRLRPNLVYLTVGVRDLLHEADTPIEHVFFPRSGVMSALVVLTDEVESEIGMIGNEGMVGVPAVRAKDLSPHRVFCQVPGEVRRLPVAVFEAELRRAGSLRDAVDRYTQALFCMVAQCSACNLHHPIGERCARWLLMTHDRVSGDEFPITHELLSVMLGVRRASVTLAASALQGAGLVSYSRGRMTILDRPRLEGAACACYGVVRDRYTTLLS
jgi:CRP-like cAMP-binding protein